MSRYNSPDKVKAWRSQLPLPCSRCGKPIMPGQPMHLDHMVPLYAGGTDDQSNIWPSHPKCNTKHGGGIGARITNARKREASNAKREDDNIRGI